MDIGVDGEIQYKGAYLLKSYPKNSEAFQKFMTTDGYARTGYVAAVAVE